MPVRPRASVSASTWALRGVAGEHMLVDGLELVRQVQSAVAAVAAFEHVVGVTQGGCHTVAGSTLPACKLRVDRLAQAD